MSGNTNSEPTVAADTDNLEDFANLFEGKAKEAKEPVEDAEPAEEPQLDDDPVAPEADDASDDEGEDDSSTDDDDPEPESKPEQKKKNTAKDRIEELNAKFRDEERKRIEAEARLRLLEEQAERQQKPANETTTNSELTLPDPNAYDANGDPVYPLGDMDPAYLRDFTTASIAIERQLIRQEAIAEQQQAVQRAEEQALLANWSTKVEAAKEEIPDIQEKGAQLSTVFKDLDAGYGEYLGRALLELENGPQVVAYLADNLSEAEAIVAGGAHKAALALGRLDARVAPHAAKTEPERKVTNAPKPPVHTSKGTNARMQIAADTDNLDDFEKLWNSKK